MERDVWRVIVAALKRLPRTRSAHQVYSSAQVLAVLLWAVLHERSVLWACQRRHWPMQAWRRNLPDQSTMSRRLRDPSTLADLDTVLQIIQARLPDGDGLLRLDAKPLPISAFSADKDATRGFGAGDLQRGYKLSTLARNARKIIAWAVEPMGVAEDQVGQRVLLEAARRRRTRPARLLLADAAYDTNAMHRTARDCGLNLFAPRKKPGTGLSPWHTQDPGRVLSLILMEGDDDFNRWQRAARAPAEHYFAHATASGLGRLPPFVRTLSRVRLWVAAKLVITAARLARAKPDAA